MAYLGISCYRWPWFFLPDTNGVDRLGSVSHIVAPNTQYGLYLTDWHEAYPAAKLHGAPGLASSRPDLHFSSILSAEVPENWFNEISQAFLLKTTITTEAVFFHFASRTVVFADML